MKKEIIDFINRHEDLIDNDEWEELYPKAANDLKSDTGKFTEYMLEADIHPENYLTELPAWFLYESGIKEFNIPEGVTNIGYSAFSGCGNLTSVVIGDSVTIISWYAFHGCVSLTSIVIPDSVTSIGLYAFEYCKELNIIYTGTKAQWKTIAKGKFSGVTYICNCVDGIIKKSR